MSFPKLRRESSQHMALGESSWPCFSAKRFHPGISNRSPHSPKAWSFWHRRTDLGWLPGTVRIWAGPLSCASGSPPVRRGDRSTPSSGHAEG